MALLDLRFNSAVMTTIWKSNMTLQIERHFESVSVDEEDVLVWGLAFESWNSAVPEYGGR